MIGNIETRGSSLPVTFALADNRNKDNKIEGIGAAVTDKAGINKGSEKVQAWLPRKGEGLNNSTPKFETPEKVLERKLSKEGMVQPGEQVFVYDVLVDYTGLTHGKFIIAREKLSSSG